jgi:hypothetical protein
MSAKLFQLKDVRLLDSGCQDRSVPPTWAPILCFPSMSDPTKYFRRSGQDHSSRLCEFRLATIHRAQTSDSLGSSPEKYTKLGVVSRGGILEDHSPEEKLRTCIERYRHLS